MQTKELRINKTMRTGVILAVIAIITLIALAMTFAKYASQGTGEDNARVAKWGLNVNENLDLKLFSSSYKDPLDQSITVDASDDASVVAPGTSQQAEVQLGTYSGQPPEVMYHFEPTLTISNLGDTGQDLITKLNENDGFTWTLKVNDGNVQTYNTTDAICTAVAALGQKDIAPNTYPTNFGPTDNPKITIGWAWDFNNGGDQSDTELGNLVANGNLKAMKVELGIKAYQCQGCSTEKKDPNLETTAPDKLTLHIDEVSSSYSATSDSDGEISVTSANLTVASVSVADTNSSSKNFSIKGVGKGSTQVTISVPETSTYKASTKTISIDVTKKTPSLEFDSYEKDYTVPTAGTFEYKYVGDGTVTVTSSDETKATAKVDTEKNIVTVTPKSAGTVVITVSATEGKQYEAISANHTATVNAGTISVESHATGWTYDDVSHSLGYIVTNPNDCNKEYRLSEEEEWTTEPTATDAGEYTVYYKASKEGYNDATGSFSVTVAKATNPMTFVLNPNTFESTYSATDASTAKIEGVNNVKDGYIVEYALEPSVEGFWIPDATDNTLECKAGTGVGIYNLTIKAICSYDDEAYPENWETGEISQNAIWTVTQAETKKAIQSTIDGQTVNFLPAKAAGSWKDYGLTFYVKGNDETYTELGEATGIDITSMSNLATAIANIDTSKTATENAAKVYTDATDQSFYGTLNRSWNTTFKQETYQAGLAEGLTDSMKTLLKGGGEEYLYKTVYFDDNDDTTPTATGNWNASTRTGSNRYPKLGSDSQTYHSFYSAYSSLLSSHASYTWSSQAVDDEDAYIWNESLSPMWSMFGRDDIEYSAVVLSKDF